MNILLLPAVTTLVFIFLLDKTKKNRLAYIIIFFLAMLGMNYLAHGDEIKNHNEFLCFPNKPLTQKERKEIISRREYRWDAFLMGMDYLQKEAKLIPDTDVRKATIIAIEGTMASVMAKNITTAAIVSLSIVLTNYLEGIYDNWIFMRWVMNQTEYDLEMYFYYDGIIRKDAELHGTDYK